MAGRHALVKQTQLFINEVNVAPTHQAKGIGKELLAVLLKVGRELNCTEVWVLTDRTNNSAMRHYSALGGVESPNDRVMFSFLLHPAEAEKQRG